jgi:serine/threonine protein kinase
MPDAIAHYRILDRIGATALGEIYRTRDTRVGRSVALTILSDAMVSDAERLNRVLSAARRAVTLSHPNIAALFDVGEDGPRWYLASEYVPGDLLSTKICGTPIDVRRAVDFAIQLADALAEGEARGISHGDIRADTIVISSKDRPKLGHFGLSEISFREQRPAHGAQNDASSDRQGALNDIRALGWVMHEMLTGRRLSPAQRESAASPATINAAVPRELDAIVRKAVSADLATSYQTAATLGAELRALAAILDARAAMGRDAVAPPPASSRRIPAATALLGLGVLLGLAAWLWRVACPACHG